MLSLVQDGNNWIQTFSGKRFFPLSPREEDVDILDIGHALSNLCRFGGHTKKFYSVAQHSVICCCHLRELLLPGCAETLLYSYHLAALLHDAAEAYIIDLPRPIKEHRDLILYKEAENRIHEVIRRVFNIPLCVWTNPILRELDNRVLATEKRDLMSVTQFQWEELPSPLETEIRPWDPELAKHMFLSCYNKISEVLEIPKIEGLKRINNGYLYNLSM